MNRQDKRKLEKRSGKERRGGERIEDKGKETKKRGIN